MYFILFLLIGLFSSSSFYLLFSSYPLVFVVLDRCQKIHVFAVLSWAALRKKRRCNCRSLFKFYSEILKVNVVFSRGAGLKTDRLLSTLNSTYNDLMQPKVKWFTSSRGTLHPLPSDLAAMDRLHANGMEGLLDSFAGFAAGPLHPGASLSCAYGVA